MEGFNISAQEKYINDDITVVFTPSSSVTKYEYVVYKDNNVVDQKTIKQKSATSILLNETGSYKIEVKTYDYYNRQTVINSGNYNIDKESPVISLNDSIIEMHTGDILKPFEGITVTDKISGNLIKQTKTNINELNLNKTGLKNLTYTVSDEAGNTASKSVPINVIQSNTSTLFVVQLSIICLLFIVAGLIVFYRRSMKLEKRITKYSVEPLKDNSLALFDSFFSFYNKQVKKIAKILSKAKII
ncbi:MAG: hypothetical protein RSB72_01315, partial [Bacilli bacterium]